MNPTGYSSSTVFGSPLPASNPQSSDTPTEPGAPGNGNASCFRFLQHSRTPESIGERLLVQFIERFLGVRFQGIQPGYKTTPDQILFAGPTISTPDEPLTHNRPTTLSVPTSILLQPHSAALQIVQQKLDQARRALGVA